MEIVITFLIGSVVGFVAGVFVYRNNEKKISEVADKVDGIADKVEKRLDK